MKKKKVFRWNVGENMDKPIRVTLQYGDQKYLVKSFSTVKHFEEIPKGRGYKWKNLGEQTEPLLSVVIDCYLDEFGEFGEKGKYLITTATCELIKSDCKEGKD